MGQESWTAYIGAFMHEQGARYLLHYYNKPNMMISTALLSLLYGLQAVTAQSFTVTSFVESTFAIFPTGVATGNSRIESTIPLACAPGCQPVVPYY
jgi:hypothetical protein